MKNSTKALLFLIAVTVVAIFVLGLIAWSIFHLYALDPYNGNY